MDDSGSSDTEAPMIRREALTSGHPLTPSAIAIWFCNECGASGDGEKSMACRACDYDMCMVCVADTVENDDDDDAHTAAHDHDAYVRPEPSCPPERRHGARLRTAAQHAF